MDFITYLPEATASRYIEMLVAINQLRKITMYLPCRKAIDLPELEPKTFKRVICTHGVQYNSVTYRRMEFTSQINDSYCSHLHIIL
jgi:hypothetical protein